MTSNTFSKKTPQWLALHFPHLPLDRHSRGQDKNQLNIARAISDNRSGRQCIIDCNQAAAQAGIRTGMTVGAALALLDSLHLSTRDQKAEQRTLKRLAGWCYQYSSQVCIVLQRDSLLLEVAGSRRLFGSAEVLARRIGMELAELGFRARSGIATTPEAAQLAARYDLHIDTGDSLRKCIGALDIACLNLPPASIQALQKMGFRKTAEVFRLPRKALARRLGLAVSDYLDRLLGHRPDPCKSFRPAERFSAGMDVAETAHTQGLIFPLKRLVQELCGILRARDRGVQIIQVSLQLDGGSETIDLHLQQATRSESHLMLLLRERLERLQLPQPVTHIRLQALRFLPCVVQQASLLEDILEGTGTSSLSADSHVIERLQARLGRDSVRGIKGLQDYRPEHSWALRELDEPASYTTQTGRPAWLLPEPQPCRIDNYRILTGPERIETGWWDGRDCRRDYFVVRDQHGSTLWAFHEYKPQPGWYLHGLFS